MGTHTGGRTDGPVNGARPSGPPTGTHHAVPVGAWRARLPLLLAVWPGWCCSRPGCWWGG